MSRYVKRDQLAKNLARARLIIAEVEQSLDTKVESIFLPFIDSTLRDYYGPEWDAMLAAEMRRDDAKRQDAESAYLVPKP